MASGGARRGRRDNGLVAAAYAAAGDVDPRVGEHLLDVLGLRGIAAYLQPAADLHPVTRTTTLPSPPSDRLYVDREHLDTARGYLAQLAAEAPRPGQAAVTGADAGPDGDGIDDAFAGIVAGFDADYETEERPWPAAEDVPDGPPPRPPALPRWSGSTVAPNSGDSLLDGLDTFGADVPDEDEDEGYTPPPPPPLPRISGPAIAALLSITAGLVVFFNPGLLPVDQDVAMVLGFAGILAGFIGLIWRLRSGDDDDDHWDPDDGAVV